MIEDILNMEWENGSWLVVEIYHLVLHMGMGNKTPSVGKEKQKIMRHKHMSCDQQHFEH